MNRLCPRTLACCLLAWSALTTAHAQMAGCPLRIEHYGPYDYRNEKDQYRVVDKYHFTPRVEALIRGESGYIGDDLAYTLKAVPNHHRALVSMVRYWERTKTNPPPNMDFTVDCFFYRAVNFRPDDHIVRMLYAQYLGKAGKPAEAGVQLEAVLKSTEVNALTDYNVGLIYFELKQYDKALAQAHRARQQGYPRSDLEDLLRKAGAWKDPQP